MALVDDLQNLIIRKVLSRSSIQFVEIVISNLGVHALTKNIQSAYWWVKRFFILFIILNLTQYLVVRRGKNCMFNITIYEPGTVS